MRIKLASNPVKGRIGSGSKSTLIASFAAIAGRRDEYLVRALFADMENNPSSSGAYLVRVCVPDDLEDEKNSF